MSRYTVKKYKQGRYTWAVYGDAGDWRGSVLVTKCCSKKQAMAIVAWMDGPTREHAARVLELGWQYDQKMGLPWSGVGEKALSYIGGRRPVWWDSLVAEMAPPPRTGDRVGA